MKARLRRPRLIRDVFSGIEGGIGRGYGRDKYQKLESILLNKITGLNDWECLGVTTLVVLRTMIVYFSRFSDPPILFYVIH